MKTVIVDDEPKAIELLKGYLSHFSTFELVGTFRNGLKAFEFMSKEKVDLIFLDINMPHLNGLSLSKMIDSSTKIIFTTAYSEYAVESYEVEAADYLLKPISLERFAKALSKLMAGDESKTIDGSTVLMVKSGTTTHRVNTKDIDYIEKDGNYSTYVMKGQKIITRESISEMLEKLPSSFLQVHKSFVVNIDRVSSVDKDTINIDEKSIPIGSTYKSRTIEILTNNTRNQS